MFNKNRDELHKALTTKHFLFNEKNDGVKIWIQKCKELLDHTLGLLPQEIDALDWKQDLSPNKERLKEHLSAFANLPGGGFLVFGVSDPGGTVVGVTPDQARKIVDRMGNLAREAVEPVVQIDHAPLEYEGASIQLIHIRESPAKPVGIRGRGMEEVFVRSGGSTRKATRQEIAGLMLNSETPRWEGLRVGPLRSADECLARLDIDGVADLLGKPVPAEHDSAIRWLEELKFIERYNGQGFYITNLGAIASARSLSDFPDLVRKSVRIIRYAGTSKTSGGTELPARTKGYAVDFEDLIGTTPESRNERLASQFRQFGLCEEQGSGLLKTLGAVEDAGLPPLVLQSTDNSFRSILQGPREFARMSPQERIEACYQHAVRLWFESEALTNASLRERLRLSVRHRSQISTLIREANNAGLLKPKDPDNRSLKFTEYIPAWA